MTRRMFRRGSRTVDPPRGCPKMRFGTDPMKDLPRITLDPAVMGGKPVFAASDELPQHGRRPAAGRGREEILKAYPFLEPEDIDQALAYAAWRVEEREVPWVVA